MLSRGFLLGCFFLLPVIGVCEESRDLVTVGPKAVTPQSVHYFGVLQPNQVATYGFTIRNEGSEVLELSKERGSCKCLQVKAEPSFIPPGGEGRLVVKWRAGETIGKPFRQLVQVKTNDPVKPTIELVVSGDVGGHLGLAPSRIEWKNAERGAVKAATVHVFSTFWDGLKVSQARSSLEGLRVEVRESAPAKQIDPLVKCSTEIVITAPAELTESNFFSLVSFAVTQQTSADGNDHDNPAASAGEAGEEEIQKISGGEEAVPLQIPVSFKLSQPLSVIGAGFYADEGRAYMGIQKPGQEVLRNYVFKVRDEEKRLELKRAVVVPESIKVDLQPYKPEAGLYRLRLRSPADSLDRAYIGTAAGKLELTFDHPRIERVEWKLEISPGH